MNFYKWFAKRERAVALVKTICLSFLTIVYNSPFIIHV